MENASGVVVWWWSGWRKVSKVEATSSTSLCQGGGQVHRLFELRKEGSSTSRLPPHFPREYNDHTATGEVAFSHAISVGCRQYYRNHGSFSGRCPQGHLEV